MKNNNAAQAARLDAMRQRMAKHHSQGSSFNYWKPAADGKEIIRILPPVHTMEFFWQEVGSHKVHEGEGGWVRCPHFTSNEELPCPICELVEQAYQERDADFVKALKVRRAFHMNVIVRAARDSGKEDQGPFIWTPGVQVFEKLTEVIGDPDFGDITDVYTGSDILVSRKGSGLSTEYHIVPGRYASSLDGVKQDDGSPNEEKIQELLKNAVDLRKVLDSLPSYDELANMLGESAAPATTPGNKSDPSGFDEEEFPDNN